MTKDFWNLLDKLVSESEIIIDRPKGSRHPRYDHIYLIDYGYLKGTTSQDGHGIDVWKGSAINKGIDAVICTVDLKKRDSEIKILYNCTNQEKKQILDFHNSSEFMKGIMIEREIKK